jgi:hypothetical protein
MTQRSLVKSISLQWDLRMGPFRAFFPNTEEDRKRCAHLAQNELFEEDYSTVIADGDQIIRQIAACEDTRTGEIVACLFLEDALQMNNSSKKSKIYNLSLFNEEQLSETVILSHLSLDNVEQKATVAQVFLSHCFIEILKAGGQAMVISCDIGYFSIYKRLGMRPIGALTKSDQGGSFIPMIFIPDKHYLTLISSPVIDTLRGADFTKYETVCAWYYKLVKENSELQIGSAVYPENNAEFVGHQSITEGLSEKGLATFLNKAMVVDCREDEVLLMENDGGRTFGFIQKGIVKVVIGGKTVVLLSEGDIFGELAFILNTKRTAQVIAASDETEIVLFSATAINSLENEADKVVIWQNLARVLAQRVVLTNRLLS